MDSLKDKYHLPENRELLSIFYKECPPNNIIKPPTIRMSLTEDINKKDVVYLMNTDQKTIGSYPDEWIHIYTGGSAFKGIMNAG